MSIYILDDVYRRIYKKIWNAMDSLSTIIELPRVSVDEVLLVYNMVLTEHPNGICYQPNIISEIETREGVAVKFYMCCQPEEAPILKDKIKNEVNKIILLALKEKNIYNVVLSVYRYFVENFKYAKLNNVDKKFHRTVSPFLYREAVCDGFSYAFAMIMNKLKIPCGVVHGRSKLNKENDFHAWNIIKIGNNCYQLDVTWDICIYSSEKKVFEYFLLDDQMMRKDHYWKDSTIPACIDASKDFLFVLNGGYMRNIKDIGNLICKSVQLKKQNICFRYIGTRKDLIFKESSLIEIFKQAVKENGCRYSKVNYGYNVDAGIVYFAVKYFDNSTE